MPVVLELIFKSPGVFENNCKESSGSFINQSSLL